jgi:non-ribosomal peptide synthase protein (TIGR01720 family)
MPEYMVPASIAVLEQMPLTSNGKVDRQALLSLSKAAPESEYEGARNEVEELLVQVWQEVLGIERIGIHDNFFELGGDSIVSIQVVARLRQQGVKFSLKEMFEHQTIAELAQVANATEQIETKPDEAVGAVALTPIQKRFLGHGLVNPHHYNQAVLLEMDSVLDESALEVVMEKLVAHHAALRLRFIKSAEGWQQGYAAVDEHKLVSSIDLSDLADDDEQREQLEAHAATIQASLNIGEGPLLRVLLFDLGVGRGARLLIAIHHLAVDGVSWRILLEDLQTAYRQASRGEQIELPAGTSTFKRWSESLGEYATSAELQQQAEYWLKQGRELSARLPVDYENGENTVASGRSVEVKLSRAETQALLQEVPKAYHTQIQEVLATALVLAMREWTGSDSLLVDVEGHGREEVVGGVDVSRTVGWFTSIYPVRLELAGKELARALKSIKEQLRGVPERGIGYGVWKYLKADEGEQGRLGELAAAEVSFNYLGQFDQVLSGGEFRAATESAGTAQALDSRRTHLLAISGMVANGQLQMSWSYSEGVHRRETIERVAEQFAAALKELIAHCLSEEAGGHTPSDFPLAKLEQKQLELIEAEHRELVDIYPLTPLQQGLMFHSLFAPGSGFYLIQLKLDFQQLNKEAFQRAWQEVINRHEILRTAFVSEGAKESLQVVLSKVALSWHEENWRAFSPEESEHKLQAYLEWDRAEDYELTSAPLMRVALMQIAEGEYHFVWSHHHRTVRDENGRRVRHARVLQQANEIVLQRERRNGVFVAAVSVDHLRERHLHVE